MSKSNKIIGAALSLLVSSAAFAGATITSVSFVDNAKKKAIATLTDGATFDASSLPSNISVQVTTSTNTGVTSVIFTDAIAGGKTYTHTEGAAPWFMCGDYLNCGSTLLTPNIEQTLTIIVKQGSIITDQKTYHFVINSGISSIASSAGDLHTCYVQSGGLFCYGDNSYGQIGIGSNISSPLPANVFASGATQVATTRGSSCGVVNGALYCWGSGILPVDPYNPFVYVEYPTPLQFVASGATQVSMGSLYPGSTSELIVEICVIVNGSVQCMGNDLGPNGFPSSVPVTIIAKGATKVSVGTNHQCAIVSGALHCWGDNTSGQLGLSPSLYQRWTLPLISISSGVTDVAAGNFFTCAIVNGAVKCFGDNTYHQIGSSTLSYSSTPITVISNGATKVSTGFSHACAITNGGALQCWGDNLFGELGSATTAYYSAQPVTLFSSGVTDVSAGYSNTCAVVNGQRVCWGYH